MIHTVGPVWHGGNRNEPELLASCYRNSLKLAIRNGIKTVAFPSISTGAYGYPLEAAAPIALETAIEYLTAQERDGIRLVRFVLYGRRAYEAYADALSRIQSSTQS